jgi:CSLREA domain-containing protein
VLVPEFARTRGKLGAALLALACSLGLILAFAAAGAAAATYVVDSTADEDDKSVGGEVCETVAGKCTLRAAIEESNASTLVNDTIEFDSSFDGQLADTIAITLGEFPVITDQVTIDGDKGVPCETQALVEGPCVGVSGSAGLDVQSSNVEIRGIAVSGAGIGVNVINKSVGFTAKDDWLGVKLDGSAGADTTGIFVDPGSNGALIGGVAEADRNVFANDGVGLDLEGASFASIGGNYFGVAPDGSTQAANSKDIEITDSTSGEGFAAAGNEVGLPVEGGGQATAACDGGCNVISGASIGIDLEGDGAGQNEAPATGSTFIKGNFVGLTAAGTDVVANSLYGIYAGGADHVTVGGFSLAEANYVVGGGEGIASGSGGEDFVVRGNRIGFASGGGKVTPPATAGIFALALGVAEAPSIEGNVIRMAGGAGIETRFETGHITGNEIEGGSIGIWTKVGEGAGLIASNTVEAATEYGILVESPDNEIRANEVVGSGLSGIRVKNPKGVAMTGNLVGGSTAEKENTIEGSGGPAIEIFEEAEEAGSWTEITRNHGNGNGGLFIDLVGGANEGIAPPSVSTALQSSAGGSAEPGATIRIFRKASAEAGELQSFLAETAADGSGNWKISYGSVPSGTLVTATQTNTNGATSELATPVAAIAEGGGGGEGGGGNGGGNNGGGNNNGNNGKGKDTAPPDTKIVKGPPKKTHKTKVKFKFTSTETGSTFQCKLDRKPFTPCRSPKVYKKLKPGKHVFKVRAIDKAGNVDPTPAKRKFTVLK